MTIEYFNYIQATHPIITYDILMDYIDDEDKYYKSIKPKQVTRYKVIEHIDKNFLLEICNEKIISNEDVDIFLELRSFLTLSESNQFISQIKIEHANEVSLQIVFDELWIHTRINRCICPFCTWTNVLKFSFKNNLYHCFSCESKWNTITFVKKHLWLTWKESVMWLLRF